MGVWYLPGCTPPLPFHLVQPMSQAAWDKGQLSVLHFVNFPGHTCSHRAAFLRFSAGAPRLPGASGSPLDTWSGAPHLTPGPWVPEPGSRLSVPRPRHAWHPETLGDTACPGGGAASARHRPLPEGGVRVVRMPLALRSPDWTSCGGPAAEGPPSILWRPCFTAPPIKLSWWDPPLWFCRLRVNWGSQGSQKRVGSSVSSLMRGG